MNNSPVTQLDTRTAITARDILSLKRRSALGALILGLLLSVGMLAGGPAVFAQEDVAPVAPAAPPTITDASRVNINTADAPTLAAGLKGVGDARAAEIVRYREAFGPFASADELMEVKGIGQSTLDMNRDVITLE